MLRAIDQFFYAKSEPANSCLNALRAFVLNFSPNINETWRYGMPFYNDHGKRICYIWVNKKTGWPYLGIVHGNLVDHPDLIAENRSKMKILPIDPNEDLPVTTITEILNLALSNV
ncbi:DUF1801 domain-containing protein [Dyadobacter sp. CY343]|uniref:DUF1801 domain-containing protein n=1 Tax=Dyadobacter sp. CY343 TaxID=2907299 RepID=UPI001F1A6F86|nr:DUF1801 domain-containing protein [Dyadobacter sp. CY343]MCE7060226.1 DUF1801 domain-containing protein [Dyadobacter sp. CY343]